MKKITLSLLALAVAALSQQRPDIIGVIMGSQKAVIAVPDMRETYLQAVTKGRKLSRPIKVIAACGNGTAGAFAPATPTTGLAGMNSGPFWPQPARTNRVAPATQAIRHSLRERFGSPAASDGGKHG